MLSSTTTTTTITLAVNNFGNNFVKNLSSSSSSSSTSSSSFKKHELGIETLKPEQFKFLTRLHYWAADTVTHGPSAEWGEHEIDYILFAQVSTQDLGPFKPNPEEVCQKLKLKLSHDFSR